MRLVQVGVVTLLLVLLHTGAASAANTLSLAVSSDPTEDELVTITLTGQSEAARSVFVYRQLGGSTCGATPSQHSNIAANLTPYYGDPVAAGAINRTYSFTPTAAGSYRICAYLGQDLSSTPLATAFTTAAVRLPTGSLALAVSSDPTEDELVTITLTGQSEAARSVFVYRQLGGSTCGATPSQHSNIAANLTPYYGDPMPAGAINRTYSFTPTAAGAYRICAYLGEDISSAPLATAFTTASVRLPTGNLVVGLSGDMVVDAPMTVTVTGQSEAARSVFVYRQLGGSTCGATPSQHSNIAANLTPYYGDPMPAGAIGKAYSFTPTAAGSYRICAYLGEDSTSTPIATQAGTGTVTCPSCPAPTPPPSEFEVPFSPFPTTLPAPTDAELSGIPAAALYSPADASRSRDRRPVFSWETHPDSDDHVVVVDRSGDVQFVATSQGVYVQSADGEESYDEVEDDIDESTGTSVPATRRTTLASESLRRSTRSGGVTVAGTVATFRPATSLTPGRYSWFVERSRRGYVAAKTKRRTITLLGPKLTRLRVKVRSKRGRTSKTPGSTRIVVTTTPYASVRIVVARAGRARRLEFGWGARTTGGFTIDWTCKVRGPARYTYTVTARDAFGNARTRRGKFRTVSATECAARRARERAAARRRAAEERRRIARQEAAERRARQREEQRLRANCAALGGSLRQITNRNGDTYTVCVGPFGNLLPFN